MSYIIVHVEDARDLEAMQILPDSEGKGVQHFNTKMEASEFLMKLGVDLPPKMPEANPKSGVHDYVFAGYNVAKEIWEDLEIPIEKLKEVLG